MTPEELLEDGLGGCFNSFIIGILSLGLKIVRQMEKYDCGRIGNTWRQNGYED
jgi:hypothetical protein